MVDEVVIIVFYGIVKKFIFIGFVSYIVVGIIEKV